MSRLKAERRTTSNGLTQLLNTVPDVKVTLFILNQLIYYIYITYIFIVVYYMHIYMSGLWQLYHKICA